MIRSFLISLMFMGFLVTSGGTAGAAANQVYLQCLQSLKAHCKETTAHVKPPNRSKAYQQCYDQAKPRCSVHNKPNRMRSTPVR